MGPKEKCWPVVLINKEDSERRVETNELLWHWHSEPQKITRAYRLILHSEHSFSDSSKWAKTLWHSISDSSKWAFRWHCDTLLAIVHSGTLLATAHSGHTEILFLSIESLRVQTSSQKRSIFTFISIFDGFISQESTIYFKVTIVLKFVSSTRHSCPV